MAARRRRRADRQRHLLRAAWLRESQVQSSSRPVFGFEIDTLIPAKGPGREGIPLPSRRTERRRRWQELFSPRLNTSPRAPRAACWQTPPKRRSRHGQQAGGVRLPAEGSRALFSSIPGLGWIRLRAAAATTTTNPEANRPRATARPHQHQLRAESGERRLRGSRHREEEARGARARDPRSFRLDR